MHTIRIAALQLGLISLETGVVGAIADGEDSKLKTLCQHTGTRHEKEGAAPTKRRDYCGVCDNDDKTTFVRGKLVGDTAVIVPPDELDQIKAADQAATKKIELTVHKAAALVGALPSGKSYFLAPRGSTDDTYAVIAALIAKRTDLAFVGEFSFGGAPALYQVLSDDGVLILRQLARPEQIKERPKVDGVVDEKLLAIGDQLADALCIDYDPAQYASKRSAALTALLAKTAPVALAGNAGEAAAPAAQVDLATALQAALAAAAPVKPAAKRSRKKAVA